MTPRGLLTAIIAVVLLLAGCSSQSPSDDPAASSPSATVSESAADDARCSDVIERVGDATQAYVDQYGAQVAAPASPTPSPSSGEPTPAPDLRQTLTDAQSELVELGCSAGELAGELEQALESVTASGPLATAVRAQLVAGMTGRVGDAAETRTVAPNEDLADVLPTLAPGSTVELAAGTHRLTGTLVVLQGITIRGAGRGRTTLVSRAPDAAVLVLTDGRVEAARLTLRHRGARAASLLIGGPSSSVVLTDATVTGAVRGRRGAAAGQGGSGVVMSARAREAGDRGTTLEVTRTRFVDNAAAGILLTGRHRASVVRSSFAENGQCGVCFLDSSSGAVRRSDFTGGAVAVIASDRTSPLIADATVTGGDIGVQATGRSTPVVRTARVSGAERAAMLWSGRARGRVTGVICQDVPFGIVVTPTALPFLGSNQCSVQSGG